jgi:hypothetical protein
VSSTAYTILEGVVLFLGSASFLAYTAKALIASEPGILLAFAEAVALNAAEGAALGGWGGRAGLLAA